VKRVLDAGPAAIMAPQIDTPAAARALVEACRYPPQVDEASVHGDDARDGADADGAPGDVDRSAAADRVDADGIRGQRGVAGSRASAYGRRLGEYVRTATEEIAVIAQIETPTAVASAGEIASVPGIDALFVGPADLSASHGRFGAYDDPVVERAVDETIAAANDAGVPVGTLATSEALIDHWTDAGYDFVIVGTDIGFLAAGADRAIARYRDDQ
jgi:2-dehydro-3-deoxyglucarate aldolase/4-hydroxy-2-oxoheptanedioate aldolase